MRSAFSTASSSLPSKGFMNTVAWRKSGDMRTSVIVTGCLASVSSCTSPRARMSLSVWRTCSPTRSRRTERVSGVSVGRISYSSLSPPGSDGSNRPPDGSRPCGARSPHHWPGRGAVAKTNASARPLSRLRFARLPSPRRGEGEDYSVRSRSSTSNVSRKSPGLMSTKFDVKVTPHSRPARTSATSSLKRRSEAISPW